MSKNTIIGIVVAVVVIGGGLYLINSRGNGDDMGEMTATPTVSVEVTPTPSVAVTSASASVAPITTGKTVTFDVAGNNFNFAPTKITVNKGDTVKIIFHNNGGTHDFKIDEFNVATKRLGTGGVETVQFVASKAGSFEYYCSVGNHRAMGMKGTLVVQ